MGRTIGIYFLLVFLIAFFMPLAVPTDVPPAGSEPLPWQAEAFKITAIYMVPAVVAWLDHRQRKRAQQAQSDMRGEGPEDE